MTIRRIIAISALMGTLAACSQDSDPDSSTAPDDGPTTSTTEESGDGLWRTVESCAPIEALVAPYIEGLDADPENGKNDFGDGSGEFSVHCSWESPETVTDLDDIRSVSVSVEPSDAVDDVSLLSETEGFTLVEDPTITGLGGVAYTLALDAVATAQVTTVSLPDTTVIVAGGDWGEFGALDGPTAVGIVVSLLGL